MAAESNSVQTYGVCVFFVEDGFAGCDLFCVLDSPRLTGTCGRSHANARRLPPSNAPPLMDLPFPPALSLTLTYSSVRVASGPASSAWRARVRRTECNVEPHRSPPEKTRRGQQGGGCRRKTFRRDVANDTTTVVCVFSSSLSPPRGRPLDGLVRERDTPDKYRQSKQ